MVESTTCTADYAGGRFKPKLHFMMRALRGPKLDNCNYVVGPPEDKSSTDLVLNLGIRLQDLRQVLS